MESKEYLRILISLRTLNNLYKSNISEEDLLIVKSFLTLLRKESLLIELEDNLNEINYKDLIQKCVDASNNNEIKDLYYEHVKPLCDSIRKLYIKPLYRAYLKISDNFIQNYAEEFFDKQIQSAFTSKATYSSDSLQPQELTTILNSFCDTQNTKDYYNPFAGLASLALKLPKHVKYRGEEKNEKTWLLGKLRMLVYNCPAHFNFHLSDSIDQWTFYTDKKYDFISFNPPFNLKLDQSYLPYLNENSYGYTGNANSLIVSHCFDLLKPEGKMAFVMPSGFLFSNNSKDKKLKKELVENGHIERIIALPNRILNHTGLAVNIIVLTKSSESRTNIEFIDATHNFNEEDGKLHTIQITEVLQLITDDSNKYKRNVNIKEVVSNDFNLSVHRYVFEDLGLTIEENDKLVKLKDLVQPISKKRAEISKGKFIRIRDLADNAMDYTKSFNDLEEIELRPYANRLDNDTLLVATTWKSLKPTLFHGQSTNVFYDFNSILAFKVNEERIDKEYLLLELQKEYVQNQIEQRRTGTAVSRVLRKDFLEVEVVLPSLDTQNKRKYSYKEAIINEQQAKVKDLMLQYGIDVADENSFLRHKIAGTLRNLRGSYSKLKQIIDEQIISKLPEVYDYKVDSRVDSNFLDYLNRIDRDLKSIHKSIQAVGAELNLQDVKLVPINFIEFISNYVEEVKNRTSINFEIEFDVDKDALIEHKIKQVIVNGDKEFLHQTFDNIIENAERHAFSSNTNNEILIFSRFDFNAMTIMIDFVNNGTPIPKGFTLQNFIRKGSKTSSGGGKGIGGWMINEIIKRHKGNLSFRDQSSLGHSYKTVIELTFPIEIKV